ncbi:class I SAM-dependent methyltransferase [Leptospira idonii]|uniref:SAM-dependent methyltransferase n=1 Tax=Leptospira idonii TaxID=1193500 RepID=A0A4R9M0B4_9LEPT|nr:class I SAM-dependent methyltransferase [Leptospira idonii]TGN19361.1 SAM-dependent methyltransferase [Leptospira idonii]
MTSSPSGTGALQMFENRLRKLKKEREKWAKKNSIECYRVYDEDIPQVPVILDRYSDSFVLYDRSSLRFQTEEEKEDRFSQIAKIVETVFAIPSESLYLKNRKKQKGRDQYEKLSSHSRSFWVKENQIQFSVNLSDYLDTGLFLDHRVTREWFSKEVKGKSVLNLFCYTGSFTVYSAIGGAASTTSVDMSNTYIDWAKTNLLQNGFSGRDHEFVCKDVLAWIRDEAKNPNRKRYDMIFLDPPTFSNSKKMTEEWDVQENHRNLILTLLTKFLTEKGEIWFSTNFRKFAWNIPEEEWKERDYQCIDLSEKSIPEDFRDKKIHRLYRIVPV